MTQQFCKWDSVVTEVSQFTLEADQSGICWLTHFIFYLGSCFFFLLSCYLERGLEFLLKAAGSSMQSLHIEECGIFLTDRYSDFICLTEGILALTIIAS